ncbi:DUF3576 domain-containing protein [Rickettsiales bacterium]|nr:DUF3576 domain-containing protein [Rickettsiales bacterium]
MFIILVLGISGCSSFSKLEKKSEYPAGGPEERRRERLGKLTGEDGLFSFGKSDNDSSGAANVGIGINSYLWRATLDTISFMPLASADPFGGVIITDWYEDAKKPNERFKLNILITGKKLQANALKVSVFKQSYSNTRRSWANSKSESSIARDIENKILTRARQLRIEDKKKP